MAEIGTGMLTGVTCDECPERLGGLGPHPLEIHGSATGAFFQCPNCLRVWDVARPCSTHGSRELELVFGMMDPAAYKVAEVLFASYRAELRHFADNPLRLMTYAREAADHARVSCTFEMLESLVVCCATALLAVERGE